MPCARSSTRCSPRRTSRRRSACSTPCCSAPASPRTSRSTTHPLHVHYFAPGSSVAEHLAADCGVALAHVLVENERDRLRTCAAPDCSHVFVDESRNRSRVYCDSRTCGNRMHVAAYRARRRDAS
ncbi:CGNR zinc finger domain-containing protein [Microbispora rosea]